MAMGQGKGTKDDHHMIEAAGGSNLDFGLKPAVKGMVGGLAAGRVGGKGKAGSNNILCKFGVHCLRDNCFFVHPEGKLSQGEPGLSQGVTFKILPESSCRIFFVIFSDPCSFPKQLCMHIAVP